MRQAILIIPLMMIFLSCNISKSANEDSQNPSITISSPASQSVVNDSVLIECEISNSEMITKIELWVNNDSTGIYGITYPFSIIWDTRDHENGTYDIFIRSYDQVGTKFDSETITIIISNFLVYSKTYGSSQANELGRSIMQVNDSSFIILGEYEDDILLMKSDRYGELEWQKSFGGSQLDVANHIEQTSDGGFIISATTESYGQGGKDIWLFKTDASGLIQWNTYLGTPYNDHAGQVLETTEGGFMLIGGKGNSDEENSDVWIIKTNSQGDSLWTRSYGGSQSDQGYDILVDEQGGFILLGSTESQGNGGKDIWLFKIDENGNEEWSHTYGNGSDDVGQSIVQTYDGGYMIRYTIKSYGLGNTAIGLLRLGQGREEIWTRTIGGSTGIPGKSLQKTSEDEYVTSCSLFDNGNNSYDAYIIKINDSGDIIWDANFGGVEDDKARSLVQTFDGGYAIAGSTKNYGNGSKLDSDVWLVKTDSTGFSRNFEE